MKSYDVVIVGAGPAGLNSAKELASRKKSVLVLEKNNVVGPKICAGGLTRRDVKYMDLPENLLEYKFKEITIHTPIQNAVVKSDRPSVYTIDRKDFGQWQFKLVKNLGVEVRTGSKVSKIGKNYVVVNGSEKVGFKYLVGADGSASIVRKYLGLGTDNLVTGIQYIVPTNEYRKLEIFFDSDIFHSWYAWIFPHRGYVSIGCGCVLDSISPSNIRKNFDKWLKSENINVSKGKLEVFPINYDYKGYKFGNVYLAGDAAGLASAYSGEGIYQALVSGEEVAKSIIDKNYVSDKMGDIIKENRLHRRVVAFLDKSGPFRKIEYELLAAVLKSKSLRSLLKYIY